MQAVSLRVVSFNLHSVLIGFILRKEKLNRELDEANHAEFIRVDKRPRSLSIIKSDLIDQLHKSFLDFD
jgi:hypothetical protein